MHIQTERIMHSWLVSVCVCIRLSMACVCRPSVGCSTCSFQHACSYCTGDVPLFTMKDTGISSASGWGNSGWDEEGWGDPFTDVQSSKPPPTEAAKNQTVEESRRLRQEERRKKQEAARQKRAAGIGSRPKLGAKSD